MDIGSILLISGLFLLTALFIGRPFFEKGNLATESIDQEHSALLAERDRTISAIQELDFDHSLRKIPAGDYPDQRKALMIRGANILRQLDQFQSGNQAIDDNTQLEKIIQSRRQVLEGGESMTQSGSPGIVSADDEYEELIAARRRSRSEKSVGFCAQCGGPIQSSDKFCSKCGANNS